MSASFNPEALAAIQAANAIGPLADERLLIGGQHRVDHEQLDPAAFRQSQDLWCNVLLVDKHQVVGPVRSLQGNPGLGHGEFGLASGIEDLQIDAKVVSRRLHELRIADPERFLSRTRVEEQHRLCPGCGSENRTEQQEAEAEKLQHERPGPKEKWPRIIAPESAAIDA